MSKIRQNKFKPNYKQVNITQKLDNIFNFFKEDIKFREIDYVVKIQDEVKNFLISIDDQRFSIVIYNLVSNSVKFTNGGQIKVSVKILDQNQMDSKMRQCQIDRRARRAKNEHKESGSSEEDEEGSQSSLDSKLLSSNRRMMDDDSNASGDH